MRNSLVMMAEKPRFHLINRVCCPICRGPLSWNEWSAVHCTACDRNFQVKKGVPDLFVRVEPPLKEGAHPFKRFLVSPAHIALLAKSTGADRIELRKLVNPRLSSPIRHRKVLTLLRGLLWACFAALFVAPHARGWLASIAVGGFAADFLWLQTVLRRQYRLELAQLLACASRGEFHEKDVKEPLSKADQPDCEEIAEDRPEVIGNALSGIDLQGKYVLHVGCGGEHDADLPQAYVDRGAYLIGLDVYRPAIAAFKKLFRADAVLAEALCMPFPDNSIDFTNCTDIIEHVHDPFKFLQENFRVLKPGGEMLLITPNRFRIRRSFSVVNPFVFLLPVLSRFIPALMFPREMIASRMLPRDVDPAGRVFVFFHTSFTRRELRQMLQAAGFEIRWLKVKAYRGHFRRLRRWIEEMPLLRDINDSVFAVARKPVVSEAGGVR